MGTSLRSPCSVRNRLRLNLYAEQELRSPALDGDEVYTQRQGEPSESDPSDSSGEPGCSGFLKLIHLDIADKIFPFGGIPKGVYGVGSFRLHSESTESDPSDSSGEHCGY